MGDQASKAPTFASYASWAANADLRKNVSGARSGASIGDSRERVSVITVAYNAEESIERTIDSIAAQTYHNVQYVIVDGKSRDRTVAIIERRSDVIDLWTSERDAGISDAFNRGIALADGEYIALVNADDWLEPTHLATAVSTLQRTGADFVFGNLRLHGGGRVPDSLMIGEEDYGRRLNMAMPNLNHPTVVCRRAVYERIGLFDLGLRVAMDYEWFLRGSRAGVVGVYEPRVTGHMSADGVSHGSFVSGLREVRDVSIRYGYPAPLAHCRFLMRTIKTKARLALLRYVPRRLYETSRRLVNPHYRSVDSRGSLRQ